MERIFVGVGNPHGADMMKEWGVPGWFLVVISAGAGIIASSAIFYVVSEISARFGQ
jgi:hypothetical protein